ncbi:MAG: hypothetical protein HOO96_15435 [Polyangiaceae bacterium]|nr:hypothetical protein [Polyangiaceae bacterium]
MRSEQRVWSQGAWSVRGASGDALPASLVFYFGAPGTLDDGARFRELAASYPNAHLIGCSTGGEILGREVLDQSVVALALQFAGTPLATSRVRLEGDQAASAEASHRAGVELAKGLPKEGLRGLFLLSDGMNVNGSALVRGVREVVGDQVVITGGLAGDGASFKETWVGVDGAPERRCLGAVGFYGDAVRLGHGSAGGWDSFGPERRITRSEGNVLYELDGSPALALYKRYLGPRAADLPGSALLFPLRIQRAPGEPPVVRTVLAVDEATQSMTFAGDVPEGARAWFMRASHDALVEGAETAAKSARGPSETQATILVSCIGRKLLMGQRVADEVESATDAVGDSASERSIGFYSYGEICPSAHDGAADLHNQTMTVTTIDEV